MPKSIVESDLSLERGPEYRQWLEELNLSFGKQNGSSSREIAVICPDVKYVCRSWQRQLLDPEDKGIIAAATKRRITKLWAERKSLGVRRSSGGRGA
ncbi:MAG: hypothetical protein ACRD5Z_26605, partial [Bryobacteraceae bacterium]